MTATKILRSKFLSKVTSQYRNYKQLCLGKKKWLNMILVIYSYLIFKIVSNQAMLFLLTSCITIAYNDNSHASGYAHHALQPSPSQVIRSGWNNISV